MALRGVAPQQAGDHRGVEADEEDLALPAGVVDPRHQVEVVGPGLGVDVDAVGVVPRGELGDVQDAQVTDQVVPVVDQGLPGRRDHREGDAVREVPVEPGGELLAPYLVLRVGGQLADELGLLLGEQMDAPAQLLDLERDLARGGPGPPHGHVRLVGAVVPHPRLPVPDEQHEGQCQDEDYEQPRGSDGSGHVAVLDRAVPGWGARGTSAGRKGVSMVAEGGCIAYGVPERGSAGSRERARVAATPAANTRTAPMPETSVGVLPQRSQP